MRTGRAGVSKITNVALTSVVSGSRERSKLYGASRRMARARYGRDGPIVAGSSPAYQSPYTNRRVALLLRHVSAQGSRRSGISQSPITRRDMPDDDYENVRGMKGFPG